ncbi:hypothetical protein KC331_g22088, partial [Hortaea werneckii]
MRALSLARQSTRLLVDQLQSKLQQYQRILHTLYPNENPERLANFSRQDLVDLAVSVSPSEANTDRNAYTGGSQNNKTTEEDGLYTTDRLQALDEPPHHSEDPGNEEPCSPGVQVISDDVNGLAFTETQHSSYVGICSNSAAFKVMWKVAPALKASMAQKYSENSRPSHKAQKDQNPHSCQQMLTSADANYIPPPGIAQHLLNSYFYHVHP